MKALPAFGKQLLAIRRAGHVPAQCTTCIVIDDWRAGVCFPRLVVVEDTDPTLLDFSMLAGLDVTVVWRPTKTTIERRDAVIREVMKIDPASLRAFDIDNAAVLWVKSRLRGIECAEYSA